MKTEDIIELQEKLIIIYKFISQKRLLNKFFFEGLEDQIPSRDLSSNPMVKEIVEMDDSSQILRECILELEEINPSRFKEAYDIEDYEDLFQMILFKNNVESLCVKFGLKDCDEIEKLNINNLIEIIE
jgi:hypothetical protein